MKYIALNQVSANCDQNQPAIDRGLMQSNELPHSTTQVDRKFTRQNLHVEKIEVYADKNYIYCKGKLSRLVPHASADVVLAVEWLDQDQNALKTDWKRVDAHPGSRSALSSYDGTEPFIIKTPLDRRVKSVKAYAFSGPH